MKRHGPDAGKRSQAPSPDPQEPIGIVISSGHLAPPAPRVTAYVYSVEDERSGEPIDVKAA